MSESSSHLSKKVVVQMKKKERKRDLTRPRRRDGKKDDASEISELSNISRKVIIETKKGKDGKGKKSQSTISKREFSKRGRGGRRDAEVESVSETLSNLSTKVIVETRKGKDKAGKGKPSLFDTKDLTRKGKYDQIEKGKKYFSKNITIVPATKEYEKEGKLRKDQKYFSKNIVIEPTIKGYKPYDYLKRTQSIDRMNLNIGTRRGNEYTTYEGEHSRTASTDKKKTGKVMEILKGVKYFTKNIVIEPVSNKYKIGDKSNYSTIGTDKEWKESSGRFGNNQMYTNERQSRTSIKDKGKEKKPLELQMNVFPGSASNEADILTESMLRNMEGIDENTKFYHKEITIVPVILPPLRFSKP